MSALPEIALGLVTAGASFLLGVGWRRAVQVFRTRQARRFWRPVLTSGTVVVLSRFKSFADFEPSGLVGAGDTRALQELSTYCRDIGIPEPTLAYDGSMTGDQLSNNLVLLGGPDANQITKLVLEKMSGRLGVVPGSAGISDGGETLRPVVENDVVTVDCGAIFRLSSPFWPDRKVVVAAGAYGWGTWAAIRLTRQADFLSQCRTLGDFECSFEVDVVLGTPQNVRIRSLRPVADHDRPAR